jgi:tetratricopeptide (TPR) repeat protein
MKFRKYLILFCMFYAGIYPASDLFSQAVDAKPTRQSSFEAFSQGNYEKAYSQFKELLVTYSKDPLYKYYSAVCLVRLGKQPEEAIDLLHDALQKGTSLKSVPDDGLFYLARAHQMAGQYAEAIETFNAYTKQAGKKTARELDVPAYLKECSQQKGKVDESLAVITVKPEPVKNDKVIPEPVLTKQEVKQPEPVSEVKHVEEDKDNYESVLSLAAEYQYKADSLSSIVVKQKKELENLTGTEKLALKLKVNDNEKLIAAYQANADQNYKQAQKMMGSADVKKTSQSLPVVKDTTKLTITKTADSQVTKVPDKPVIKISEKQTATSQKQLPLSTVSEQKDNPQVDIYSYFEVLESPVPDPKARVVIDPVVPEGLIYRIQLGVLKNPIQPSFFKGVGPAYGFRIEGTDKIVYYVGMFRKHADAAKALTATRSKGFTDAFIVPLMDGKKISVERAAQLEKTWGTKPFLSIESMPETRSDTTAQTLVFRVEVMRTSSPVTEEVTEELRKLAGNKGLEIIKRLDGKISYLIGKFITFETAEEYADLLKRNGYKESQVASWLGKKEIPVESAKKLFDDLK